MRSSSCRCAPSSPKDEFRNALSSKPLFYGATTRSSACERLEIKFILGRQGEEQLFSLVFAFFVSKLMSSMEKAWMKMMSEGSFLFCSESRVGNPGSAVIIVVLK